MSDKTKEIKSLNKDIDKEFSDDLFDNDINNYDDDNFTQDDNDIIDIDEEDFDMSDIEDLGDQDLEEDKITSSINFDYSESDLDVYFKFGTNNHKLDGKHSLKRDTILHGKLNERIESENSYYSDMSISLNIDYENADLSIEKGSVFYEESRSANDLQNRKKLSEDVYNLLRNNTELDFKASRRKPNKATFNNYYKMLLSNIDKQYTQSEIFVELSYYFTDNIFNMYKLLDKKYATSIIKELRDKGFLNNLDINFY